MGITATQERNPAMAQKRFSICLAILLAAGIGLLSGCHHEPLPAKLVGAWISPDVRFDGRVLEISPDAVEISVHEDSVAFYSIKNVSIVSEQRLIRVMLDLEDMQHIASRMILNYDSQRDSLWIENRPDTLWHRKAE